MIIDSSEIIHGSEDNKSKQDRIGMVISFKGKKSGYDKTKLKEYKLLIKKNIDKIYKEA